MCDMGRAFGMMSSDNLEDQDQSYIGFQGKVNEATKIGFTDTFFYYLLGEAMSVEQALYETIDLRYGSHTNRCERVRAQGNSPSDCYIPPR